jgi:hypothetical protein
MIRLLAFILCLFPAVGFAQRASETNAAELRWLDRTSGELHSFIITVGDPLTLGPLEIHLPHHRLSTRLSIRAMTFGCCAAKYFEQPAQAVIGWRRVG